MALSNDARTANYLRDRSELTPAQARRVRKHERRATAEITPAGRRAGRRWVLATDRTRRTSIRAAFRFARGR